MAPALSGVLGSEVTAGLALAVSLTGLIVFLLLSVLLLMLCASCQGQKKGSGPGDHENLMNGVSEKETCSQSVESHGTDMAVSSSHNGPVTTGTALSETMDTSPQPSEDLLSSQSEIRSSKCHQDRELPSIPPSDVLQAGDGPYEMVKEGASRDISVEDSLYETVKELANGTLSPEEPAASLISPSTPDHTTLPNGVEYASINLSKKSRYSTDMEARRSAILCPVEPEEEKPPPIPDKVLDENDNQHIPNGQLHTVVSTPERQDNASSPDSEPSTVYSKVLKNPVKETEHDYSSIGEIKAMVLESTSCGIYATVSDECSSAGSLPPEGLVESVEPGYETIKISKAAGEANQANGTVEPDYESVGELGLNDELSHL